MFKGSPTGCGGILNRRVKKINVTDVSDEVLAEIFRKIYDT
jgi:hypothetical protein